jgi:hypothetical protein
VDMHVNAARHADIHQQFVAVVASLCRGGFWRSPADAATERRGYSA